LLIALGAVAIMGAVWKLVTKHNEETNVAGLIIACVSLGFMFFLWYEKAKTAVVLQSNTLAADASCSLSCIELSVALLIGSALRHANESLWWVDGTITLIMGVLIVKEGVEVVRGVWKGNAIGCGCDSDSRVVRWLYKRTHTGNGQLRLCVKAAWEELKNPALSRSGAAPVNQPGCEVPVSPIDDDLVPRKAE
jgi:hypothetical protein